MRSYLLDPAMPVLVRPDGSVQVGWDPRRAVLVRPPQGLTATALAGVLRMMQVGVDADDVAREAVRLGSVDTDEFAALIEALVRAGVARPTSTHPVGRTPSIRIHGRGP